MKTSTPKTLEQGQAAIAELCRHFATNRDKYREADVKEAHVRQSLIDPFFAALGWDVANAAMAAPQYREVIPEDSLDVEGQPKAPDYAFRAGTLTKFYAEARKCGVNIQGDPAPAYQLRRYGWNAKVGVSILTDFEEWGVYDCTTRPTPTDKASHARIQTFGFQEYPALARNIALRNVEISSEDLNAAVQLTINRVVFLRMAEDRGLEPYEQLLKLGERDDIYARFMREVCRRADEKYNSGLFHFEKEAGGSEAPDKITPKLSVDDKVFKPIIQSLYFAYGSPYDFRVLPVEILGTVYERFLGKVIRLTAGHQAKVEEKPEVRKAGGVYYTPSYIVDYIVKQTVGRKIEGQSPTQLAGGRGKSPVRVLDMACGSGSFLLGAYQYLLDHCLKWYLEHRPDKHKRAVYQEPRQHEWRLTIEERKRILTTHLFGVDIDAQAVEVTKLSLLLKALEGENDATLSLQLRLLFHRALPNLAKNIKCGNSLIGSDYLTGRFAFDNEAMNVANAFDWEQGFVDAMKVGGFDCVIGNPPYIRVRTFKELYPSQARYLEENYQCATHVWDIYLLFFERAAGLVKDNGSISLIVPIQTLHQPNCESLRRYLLSHTHVRELADLSHLKVFEGATVKNCILTCDRIDGVDGTIRIRVPRTPHELADGAVRRWAQSKVHRNPGLSLKVELLSPVRDLCDKLRKQSWVLKDLCYSTFGLRSCAKGKGQGGKERLVTSHADVKQARPYLEGRNIGRYAVSWTRRFIRYLPAEMYSPRSPELFETPKIVSQTMLSKPSLVATYDDREFYVEQSLACVVPHGIVTNTRPKADLPLKFILGVINSNLERFYFASYVIDQALGGGLIHATPGSHDKLIVPKASGEAVENMVSLVDSILTLNEQFAGAKSAAQRGVIRRHIEATDRHIDHLVYRLYGLTDDEIRIVEASTDGVEK
ncbi:MAG: Eco57I restriction-modification methylase domain-containing protein [Planctomycetota bacterium]|nr:Eco57I restriction-modification methylase domain-containing protein [Planctomycetota bacterium]